MKQNLRHYDKGYYGWDNDLFVTHGLLRADQLSALCYALRIPYWGMEYDSPDGSTEDHRHPGRIVSIGAGKGILEKKLEEMGYEVIGVDPSPGALALYVGKTIVPEASPELIASAKTLIFCESIEHIPQVAEIFSHVTPGTLVIIVNYPDYHPIVPAKEDGWDHINLINDDFFDQISQGFEVKYRFKSHLVMEKL